MTLDLPCDWKSGFVTDPNKKERIGYLVHFEGLGLGEHLTRDIEASTPYTASEAQYGEVSIDADRSRIICAGVLDSFSYGGGVGDPICVSAYISAENADVLSSKTKTALDTTVVRKLAWWIIDFDEENKAWYEAAYPLDPTSVRGHLDAPGGADIRLAVAQAPTKVAPHIDFAVHNLYFEVVPAADSTFDLHFANSSKTKYVKRWGPTQATLPPP